MVRGRGAGLRRPQAGPGLALLALVLVSSTQLSAAQPVAGSQGFPWGTVQVLERQGSFGSKDSDVDIEGNLMAVGLPSSMARGVDLYAPGEDDQWHLVAHHDVVQPVYVNRTNG